MNFRGKSAALSLILASSTVLAVPTGAQWIHDGAPICTARGDQLGPIPAADGSGGAFILWTDYRDSGTLLADVYLQRVTADGEVAPGWPRDGLPVCALEGYQFGLVLHP